jgi:hypothetical protein
MLDWINWLSNWPFWPMLTKYLITVLGSFLVYLYFRSDEFDMAVKQLRTLFPQKTKTFYERLHFFIFVFVGALAGAIIASPAEPVQALTAGATWTATMKAFCSKEQKNDN